MRVIAIIALCLIIAGCEPGTKRIESPKIGRFAVIETGRFQDGRNDYYRILIDRETGAKYLYVWMSGLLYDGPALTAYQEE